MLLILMRFVVVVLMLVMVMVVVMFRLIVAVLVGMRPAGWTWRRVGRRTLSRAVFLPGLSCQGRGGCV